MNFAKLIDNLDRIEPTPLNPKVGFKFFQRRDGFDLTNEDWKFRRMEQGKNLPVTFIETLEENISISTVE